MIAAIVLVGIPVVIITLLFLSSASCISNKRDDAHLANLRKTLPSDEFSVILNSYKK